MHDLSITHADVASTCGGPQDGAPVSPDILVRLAHAVSKNSRALLLDAENKALDEPGWLPIEQAARIITDGHERARTFTVEVRDDILAIEVDPTDERHQGTDAEALTKAFHQLAERMGAFDRIPVVVVASGRRGHRHMFARISDPAVRGRYSDEARKLGLEPRRAIRPPLAPHRLGLPVALLEPEDPHAALDRLRPSQARPLSPAMARLLREGDRTGRYRSRSEVVLALAVAGVNAGWSEADFEAALLDPGHRGAEKIHGRPVGAARRYLGATWAIAVRFVAARPAFRDGQDARARIADIRRAARTWAWSPRAGLTDRAVLEAHLTVADSAASTTYRVDVRRLAEMADVTKTTISAANHRLIRQGLLRRVSRGYGTTASTWTLRHPGAGANPDSRASLRGGDENYCSGSHSDLWRAGGLGKSGGTLWWTLDLSVPQSPAELAARLRWSRWRVRRNLSRLAQHGLAGKLSGGWIIGSADPDEVAAVLGVAGEGHRQRARHADERVEYAARRARRRQASAWELRVFGERPQERGPVNATSWTALHDLDTALVGAGAS